MSMRLLLALVSTFLLALLAGCATTNVAMLPKTVNNPSEMLAGGKGLVAIQIADSTPLGQSYPVNYVTFAPKNYGESEKDKFPRAEAIDTSGLSTTWILAALPENEYSIRSLNAYYYFGNSYVQQFYPADIGLGTFNVEAGKITNLGVLAVYIGRRNDSYLYETTRASKTISDYGTEALQAGFPLLLGEITNLDAPLTWNEDGLDADRRSNYRNAVNRQIAFGEPYINEGTGEIIYTGPLGVILRRQAEGEWVLDAFDEDIRIRQFLEINGQEILLTEFGTLYSRQSGSNAWEPGKEGGVDGEIVFLTQSDAGQVIAVAHEPESVAVWDADSIEGPWTKRAVQEITYGFWTAPADPNEDVKGATYIKHGPYIFMGMERNVYRYSIAANMIENLGIAGPSTLQARNGFITVRGRGSWGDVNKVSFDNGDSWKTFSNRLVAPEVQAASGGHVPVSSNRRATRNLVGHPIFIDPSNAYVTHAVKDEEEKRYLVKTVDGGRKWMVEDLYELPEGCADLIMAKSDDLLLGCYLSGEFYSSSDGGKSWELERAVSEQ